MGETFGNVGGVSVTRFLPEEVQDDKVKNSKYRHNAFGIFTYKKAVDYCKNIVFKFVTKMC